MSFITQQLSKSYKKKDKIKWKNYKYYHLDGSNEYHEPVDDATNEEIELENSFRGSCSFRGRHSKSRTTQQQSTQYVEHSIKEGDTLQKLSLVYGCPVAELKKANRILSIQEFYGLKTIRIPVKQFSVLTEILPFAECSKTVSSNNDEVRTFHVGISQVLNGEKKSEAASFLEKMDEDLTRIRESTKSYKDSLEEVTETLTSPQFKAMVGENKSMLRCSGADYGLHWKSLVCVVIIFIFFLPLAGIIYFRITTPVPPGNYSKSETT